MTAVLMSMAVFVFTMCDFPSDPPLKSVTTDPPAVTPTDSTGVLLPLRKRVQWVYLVEVPMRPPSSPRLVSPRELEFDGGVFYYVPYIVAMGGPGGLQAAFPVLLRNDSLGLSFYQPVRAEDTTTITLRPKFMFTLPYPARVGRTYSGRNPEYSVRLTNMDTLITMYSHPVSLPCHRYEVWHGPRLVTVLYIVPGLCILRIEDEDRLFHTIGWSI
ncbi:MAG: hypothetical protein WBQ23_15925 [Bacteroidota bacterium]